MRCARGRWPIRPQLLAGSLQQKKLTALSPLADSPKPVFLSIEADRRRTAGKLFAVHSRRGKKEGLPMLDPHYPFRSLTDAPAVRPGTSDALTARTIDATVHPPLVRAQETAAT